MRTAIRRKLLAWYDAAGRTLPWRESRDPYKVWISEVMLQQTRVTTVLPYYTRFLERFPTLARLADAPADELLATWSGLGYYSRARNLQRAAQQMAGQFPRTLHAIRELPGVGEYTAAAVASIAFGLPHAAIDGNALRVFARLTAERGDIGHPEVRTRLASFGERLLDRARPGDWNQAVMDLGATVCVPRQPACGTCPVRGECAAYAAGIARELPVKQRKPKAELVEKTVYLVRRRGQLLLQRRPGHVKRLAGFWELPEAEQIPAVKPAKPLGTFRHAIAGAEFRYQVHSGAVPGTPEGFEWIGADALPRLPLTTVTRKALRFIS